MSRVSVIRCKWPLILKSKILFTVTDFRVGSVKRNSSSEKTPAVENSEEPISEFLLKM